MNNFFKIGIQECITKNRIQPQLVVKLLFFHNTINSSHRNISTLLLLHWELPAPHFGAFNIRSQRINYNFGKLTIFFTMLRSNANLSFALHAPSSTSSEIPTRHTLPSCSAAAVNEKLVSSLWTRFECLSAEQNENKTGEPNHAEPYIACRFLVNPSTMLRHSVSFSLIEKYVIYHFV